MKLQLYYPVKPSYITQKFGETANLAYYHANGINIPGHNGIDFLTKHGQPIFAAHDGAAYYEVDANQGHGVVLLTNDRFDYDTGQAYFKSIYWHLCDSSKEPQFKSPVEGTTGLKVKAGDLIGYADTTGLSTGDHLHFGLKPVANNEPAFTWLNLEQDNGYMGAIDPAPYFNGQYAADLHPSINHTFYIPLKYGDTGSEVLYLQRCLKSIGYFPANQDCTGYYGSVTRSSVFQFQRDFAVTDVFSFIAVWSNFGNNVGPLTLKALNKKFA